MRTVQDWKGLTIQLGESVGGVWAFAEPSAGLVRGGVAPWPAPEVIQKLYKSRQQHAFRGEDLDCVTSHFGHYTDLQSVHSEDAITWNVFGPVAHAGADVRSAFFRELLSLMGMIDESRSVEICLWRRVPHPDTLVPGGPELDFLIQTADTVIFGEAKWRSSVGSGQGVNRDKDQITLRREFLEKFGPRVFEGVTRFIILGASWEDPVLEDRDSVIPGAELYCRNLRWEALCNLSSHPARAELQAYYAWKVAHSQPA